MCEEQENLNFCFRNQECVVCTFNAILGEYELTCMNKDFSFIFAERINVVSLFELIAALG